MADFRFDAATGRYRSAAGKFVTEKAVRETVDRLADAASEQLRALSTRLRAGEMTLADWQRQSMQLVKDVHVAAGMAAHGGRAAMDQETYGAIGRRIRDEYGYLRDFAQQIASGTQPLNGQVSSRARMFGQAGRVEFEAIRARDDVARGFTEERNVLHTGESCEDCRAQSAKGWVAVGTLTPIGERRCRSNDRCSITRRSPEQQTTEARRLRVV